MIVSFGPVDLDSKKQLEMSLTEATTKAVLCADHHLGYSHPIGGVIALRNAISLSGVGVDIACGNKAVMTNIKLSQLPPGEIAKVMAEISKRVPCGMGNARKMKVKESPIFEDISLHPLAPVRALIDNAQSLLGSIGGGNHYLDLLVDAEDRIWIGCHFGSRGFGFKLANGFMSLARGGQWGETPKEGYWEPPILLPATSTLAQDYLSAMEVAGDYAYAGRNVVVQEALDVLGATSQFSVHNHHNFCWKETHFGDEYFVVRKGATPAFPGQFGFVGGSMRDVSVILRGVDSARSRDAFYSTVHGAGRVMSRRKAAGKSKPRKLWQCGNRDCGFSAPRNKFARTSSGVKPACPSCEGGTLHERLNWETIEKGVVDFPAVQAQLQSEGIVLLGAGADEAPECYKPLPDVLAAHSGTIEIVHTLRPIGVLMAGRNDADPYGD